MTTKTTPSDDQAAFDAWLTTARLPERSVTVYGRADLVAEMEELEQQLRSTRGAVVDDRLGGASGPGMVASRIEELRAQMSASAMTFRFRALTKAESRAVLDGAPRGADGERDEDHVAAHWVAAGCVSHAMTAEQVREVRDRIGEGQFASLWDAAWGASNDKRVSVPFWPGVSAVANSGTS